LAIAAAGIGIAMPVRGCLLPNCQQT